MNTEIVNAYTDGSLIRKGKLYFHVINAKNYTKTYEQTNFESSPIKSLFDFVTANRTRTFTNFLIIYWFFGNKFVSVRSNRTLKTALL
jgi:hypothetical protein